MKAPDSATLFAYNVGFGDCLLLRFDYEDGAQKHMLVDFGTAAVPDAVKGAGAKAHMLSIAKDINEKCGGKTGKPGKLDILVATHRHKDHISGFATNKKKTASGDVIASLGPDYVLMPWTEDPDVAAGAKGPLEGATAFAAALKTGEGFAAMLASFAGDQMKIADAEMRLSAEDISFLKFLGDNNVANKSAVANLLSMGKAGREKKAFYLHADLDRDGKKHFENEKKSIEQTLPGVKLHILGPPTVTQSPNVEKEAANVKDQYWMRANEGEVRNLNSSEPLFPGFDYAKIPPHARWMKKKLLGLEKDMLFSLTVALDSAMNNTSLILLLEIGDKILLFPGDAQWENWEYALSVDAYVKKLKSVDVYKVGHHGSRNATPKKLWNMMDQKSKAADKKNRLVSVLSTKKDVFGKSADTLVPQAKLVAELEALSHLHSTETTPSAELCKVIKLF